MSDFRSLIIDQSSTCCGFAVMEGIELREHGVLLSRGKSSTVRLLEFWNDLKNIAHQWKINEVVFEKLHYSGGKITPMANIIEPMAGAAMICKFVACDYAAKVYTIRPQTWKSVVGAKGNRANIKADVRRKVCQYWDIDEAQIRSSDHSDALGMAAYWQHFADEYRMGARK